MSAALEERAAEGPGITVRVETIDWQAVAAELDSDGWAILPQLLTPEECHGTADLYEEDARFRSRVVMARHGFGRGEYGYFAPPLPDLVASLRGALYPCLAPVANC